MGPRLSGAFVEPARACDRWVWLATVSPSSDRGMMSAWLRTLIVGVAISALGGLLMLIGTAEWLGILVVGGLR